MSEVQFVGQTYQEYLRQVRAEQFGYVNDEVTSITEGTTVIVEQEDVEVEEQLEETPDEKVPNKKKPKKKVTKEDE